MELDSIRTNLDAVRRRVRFYYMVHGLGRIALMLAGFVVFTYLADYLIPKLPVAVRAAFLLGGIGGLAYVAWRHLLYPMGREISDDDIALCVEKSNPQLRDRLISALQLSRNLGKPGEERFNSPELVKVIVEDATQAVKGIPFLSILTARIPARVMVKGSFAVAAVAAYFIAINPAHAVKWAQRDLLLRNVPWADGTHIRFVFEKNADGSERRQVARGEKFMVRVFAAGAMSIEPAADAGGFTRFVYSAFNFVTGRGKRPQVRLSIQYEGESQLEVERMIADPDGGYHHEILAVRNSFKMKAETDDAETEWVYIHASTPPRIERIHARYDYPDYTGLKDTPADRPEEGGNLKAPAGTVVHLEAEVNVALRMAQLHVQHGHDVVPSDMTIGPRASGAGSIVRGDITLSTDGEYTVFLLSDEGLPSSGNRYSFRAVQDTHPLLKVIAPAMDKSVTPAASVPLVVMTTDDYAVTEVAFFWVKVGSEPAQPNKVLFDNQHNKGDYGTTKVESEYVMEISAFGAKEGEVIRYWVEAKDNHAPEAQMTKSKEYSLSVISKNAKETQLEETIARLKAQLQKDADAQAAEQKRVREVQQPFAAKDQLTLAEKKSISSMATSQRQVGQRLERLSNEFEQVLKDVEENKLMDPASKERLDNVHSMINDVAKQKSPQAAEQLSMAETTPRAPERGEKLANAADRQQEAIDELQKALEELGKWEDYQEVVKAWREVLLRHQELKGQIQNK